MLGGGNKLISRVLRRSPFGTEMQTSFSSASARRFFSVFACCIPGFWVKRGELGNLSTLVVPAISGLRESTSEAGVGAAACFEAVWQCPSFRIHSRMARTVNSLFFGGKGVPFSNNAQEVELWGQVANLEPVNRAPAFLLLADPAAPEERIAAGSDEIMDGATEITQPGEADSIVE